MGLDPYNTSSWPNGLIELLESLGEENPPPIVTDFLSTITPENATLLWEWVQQAREFGKLGSAFKPPPLALNKHSHGGQAGVKAADLLRKPFDYDDIPQPSIETLADRLGLGSIVFEDYNHQTGRSIRAAVGWQHEGKAMILGPKPKSIESQRFLIARGLFHATFMCEHGDRLITRTHDWDQQASRGFAAELLAPRAALVAAVPPDQDDDERADTITNLAQKYQVHAELIQRQLQNAARFGI